MSDYDPDNPQHPLDKWWERNKMRLAPVLFLTMPLALFFYIKLLALAFDEMPRWIWLGGGVCTLSVFVAVATLLDEIRRLEKRLERLRNDQG